MLIFSKINQIIILLKTKKQDRQELNPRRGALETPALPLSYGPILFSYFLVTVGKPGSVK